MASQEHGCARCLTPCAGSGLTMKARRFWVQGKMRLLGNLPQLAAWVRPLLYHYPSTSSDQIYDHNMHSGRHCRLCGKPRRCVAVSFQFCSFLMISLKTEIVMVRLQGDFAKPPEKRFNYKHCFDALFRVSAPSFGQKGLSYMRLVIGA
jgi:hypothetical protein